MEHLDNYNYEKGAYSTIQFVWDDDLKTLVIHDRNGEFSGMLKERIFNIVIVSPGVGEGVSPEHSNRKTVAYHGEKIKIAL